MMDIADVAVIPYAKVQIVKKIFNIITKADIFTKEIYE